MGFVEGVGRDQMVMFPESLDEYIAEDNPVRFVDAFVGSLDLGALGHSGRCSEDSCPTNRATLALPGGEDTWSCASTASSYRVSSAGLFGATVPVTSISTSRSAWLTPA